MNNVNNISKIVQLSSTLVQTENQQQAAEAALLAQIQLNLATTASTTLGSSDPTPVGASAPVGPDSLYNQLESALYALEQNPSDPTALQNLMNVLQKIGQDYSSLTPQEQADIANALSAPISGSDGSTYGQTLIDALMRNFLADNSGSPNLEKNAEALLSQLTTVVQGLSKDFPNSGMISDIQKALNALNATGSDGNTGFEDWFNANTATVNGNTYLTWRYQGVTYLVAGEGQVVPPGGIPSSLYMQIQMGASGNFIQNSNVNAICDEMLSSEIAEIMQNNKDPGMQLMLLMMLLTSGTDNMQSQIGGVSTTGNAMQTASNLISQILGSLSSGGTMTPSQAQQLFSAASFLQALGDLGGPALSGQQANIDSYVKALFSLPVPGGSSGETLGQLYQQCAASGNFTPLANAMSSYAPTPPSPGPNPTPNPNTQTWQQLVQNFNNLTQQTSSQSSAVLQEMNQITNTMNTQEAALKNGFDSYAQWCLQIVQNQIARG